VIHLHAILRKAFLDAVIIDGLIGSNPVERAKRPRVPAREPGTVWTIAQLQAFLATARQHRLFAFFHLAAYTGGRRGELLNLRWADVDLDAKKITISGSTAVVGGERINGTTKSGRTRVIAIDNGIVAVLRQHKASQAAEQALAGNYWRGTSNGYVFTTGWGEPIYPDTASSLMTRLIRAHNHPKSGPRPKDPLPHARLHDLRHLHATTLLLSGVPVHVVAARLGHADPAITLRVYAHVIPHRRGRSGRHLRPGREHPIRPTRRAPLRGRRTAQQQVAPLAKVLAKMPLPISEGAADPGAALGNRTPDLRITRSPPPRSGLSTCTDSRTCVPGCSECTVRSEFRATTRATVRPAYR
jgi:integrase